MSRDLKNKIASEFSLLAKTMCPDDAEIILACKYNLSLEEIIEILSAPLNMDGTLK
jgi:hypothetical protein